MAKTEKLFHPATGLYQEIQTEYVPAHLANGWIRNEKEKAEPEQKPVDSPDVETEEDQPEQKEKPGKRK